MRRFGLVAVLAGLALSVGGGPLSAQVRLTDLVFTAGVAGEGYWGNFPSVSVPQIDSATSAVAGTGDFSFTGIVSLLARENRNRKLQVGFDGGLRQFTTGGFQLRNYAPREYYGDAEVNYGQFLGGGFLDVTMAVKARGIADRPPMPLYLQPGYERYIATARFIGRTPGEVFFDDFDVGVTIEDADYAAPKVLPQLDLLDRSSVQMTLGTTARSGRSPQSDIGDDTSFRLSGGYRYHKYPQKGLGIFRRDHAIRAGATWSLNRRASQGSAVEVGLEFVHNLSNSRRVEYNFLRINAVASKILGENTIAQFYGTLAWKAYIYPIQDALVPGEEADNASILRVELTRFLGSDVSGSFGLGWTKAETNIGGNYFKRFGASFRLRVRPEM